MKINSNLPGSLTTAILPDYELHLHREERSKNTIEKYIRDLRAFFAYVEDRQITKELVLEWKEKLTCNYAASSVNSMLAAVNGLLDWLHCPEYKVKPIKIQREIFSDPEKELTRDEYVRLVRTAQASGKEQLSLVIQTICATGIRVSELQYITVEAVHTGRAEVNCKGKRRTVFLPDKLCRTLGRYSKKKKRTAGSVFVTKSGKPLDRSNIWRNMKALCDSARVNAEKVFPHNLRHLFARMYYKLEKDLSRLADILGHTNINTTRIYTAESGSIHARQLGRMELIIT